MSYESDGDFYHIYNRGAGRAHIFLKGKDKDRFLQALYLFNNESNASNIIWRLHRSSKDMSFEKMIDACKEKKLSRKCIVSVLAYCLKDNHYHLLLKEIKKGGVSLFMQKMGGYARYFNNVYSRKGAVYERRYQKKKVGSKEHLRSLLGYINVVDPAQEIAPLVLHKGVCDKRRVRKFVDKFRWSSHRYYLRQKKKTILENNIIEDMFGSAYQYSSFVDDVLERREDVRRVKHLFFE